MMLFETTSLDTIACSTALEVKLLAALVCERRARQRASAECRDAEAKLLKATSEPPPEPQLKPTPAPRAPPIDESALVANQASIEQIQRAVCRLWGISLVELKSERRTGELMDPRQIAAMLCRALTLKSFPTIGRKFGGRDHTTVLHGANRWAWLQAQLESELAPEETLVRWVERAYECSLETRAPRKYKRKPMDIPAFLVTRPGNGSHN